MTRTKGATTAIIVGGTSGVGLQSAVKFSQNGCRRMILVGRDPDRGLAALAHVRAMNSKAEVEFFAADASDEMCVQRIASFASAYLEHVDILVNCAGGDHVPALFTDTEPSSIMKIVNYVLAPTLLMCRYIVPGMYARRCGSIVNLSSDAAKVATPGETIVGAGLAAIVMFSRALAIEAKRHGVRVNAVTPSLIRDTPTYDRVFSQPFSAKLFAKAARAAHLGVVEPGDVAELIVFLAGPKAAKITGQAISVNGGISAA